MGIYLITAIISFILFMIAEFIDNLSYKILYPEIKFNRDILYGPILFGMCLVVSLVPIVNISLSIYCIYTMQRKYLKNKKELCNDVMNKLME